MFCRHNILQGLLGTSRRLTVVSILGGLDDAGTDCNSALQNLSDYVLSYPVEVDDNSDCGYTSGELSEGQFAGSAAMRQQMKHVAAMGSRTIAQQMVINALVAEVIDRLEKVMDAEDEV